MASHVFRRVRNCREVSHYPRHKTNSTNTAVDFLELPFRPLDGCWCLESIHHLLLGCPSSFGGWCGYDVMTTLARKNEYCDKRNTLNSRATHFETYPNDVFQDILNMEFFECQTLRMSEGGNTTWYHTSESTYLSVGVAFVGNQPPSNQQKNTSNLHQILCCFCSSNIASWIDVANARVLIDLIADREAQGVGRAELPKYALLTLQSPKKYRKWLATQKCIV